MMPKIALLVVIALVIVAVKFFNLQDYLTLAYLQENLEHFHLYYQNNWAFTIALFMGFYIVATALSIPGAAVLTIGAGALFGRWTGTLIVSFASTIGATLAFLIARFFLRDFVEKKFADKLRAINVGIEKEGAIYLLTLRLVPLFPFFLINLAMGLTSIRTMTFFFVSQVGMLAGTFVYVNAGQEISKITSISGILSPRMVLAFSLLGIFPLLAKKGIELLRRRKLYLPYAFSRPSSFDYDIVAIGGGAAGLVTCYITASLRARAALIEKSKMGGDCLNTGCVPSKALIKAAKVVHQARLGEKYGLVGHEMKFDFAQVMERIQRVIKKVEPHDSIERYTELGVHCFQEKARVIGPWEVEVGGKRLSARHITIATGAAPFIPPIPGLSDVGFLVSDNLWKLRKLPKKLAVLGGGPIGLEMAQCFQRLGSQVTVVEMSLRLMMKEDADVADYLEKRLAGEGVTVLTGHQATQVKKGAKGQWHQLLCRKSEGEGQVSVEFDEILVAVGRRPRAKGFGLEELGIEFGPRGGIVVNQYMQTNFPNIYACGDVVEGSYQLTHMAAHQAWYCAVNSLFGRLKKFRIDTSAVPWATYTDPEVATVGRMEWQLKAQGIPYEVVRYDLDDLDRAIADGEDYGFVKVCMAQGKDRILGATIVGTRASDIIIEFISAIKHGLGLNKILSTIHPYPSMGEANKYLAGKWKQAHRPEKILRVLEEIFSSQRG